MQRVLETTEFGLKRCGRASFVLVARKLNEEWWLFSAKVLLLQRMNVRKEQEAEEFVCFLYMECTACLNDMGAFLESICMQWSGDDGIHQTVESLRGSRDRNGMRVGERFGVEPLDTMQ